MNRIQLVWLIPALCIISCKKKQSSNIPGLPTVFKVNTQHISVLTQHNDNSRRGWNNKEGALNTADVNSAQFGKLFSLYTDDQVYAQPLVLSGVSIGAGSTGKNVVFIATVNNTVYAYDGDNSTLYWKKNYTQAGMRPPKNSDMGQCGGPYMDFSGNIGIVGTPVIDSIAQTIYFVSRSTDGTNFVQYLHAVSVINGDEQAGSPTQILAQVAGNGDGNVNGVISFNSLRQNQRLALTLINGTVYIGFSSHCDIGPYHGWVLGYDEKSLKQTKVYNDTPNGYSGGIWESGTGIAADEAGSLYLVTGNGTVGYNNDPTNLINRGESALKLVPNDSSLSIVSWFTPFNYVALETDDLDYGAMGAFLIPGSSTYVTGGKDGHIYLLNKDNMGGYNSSQNQIQQTIDLGADNLHCQPSYFKSQTNEFIYVWSENDKLRAFPFSSATNLALINQQQVGTTSGPTGQNGAVLTVSSNGGLPSTGILWASYAASGDAEHTTSPGILRAFDANDITHELWNSSTNSLDIVGNYAKFASPTVANGHVYLPTFSNSVVVYGLR